MKRSIKMVALGVIFAASLIGCAKCAFDQSREKPKEEIAISSLPPGTLWSDLEEIDRAKYLDDLIGGQSDIYGKLDVTKTCFANLTKDEVEKLIGPPDLSVSDMYSYQVGNWEGSKYFSMFYDNRYFWLHIRFDDDNIVRFVDYER